MTTFLSIQEKPLLHTGFEDGQAGPARGRREKVAEAESWVYCGIID